MEKNSNKIKYILIILILVLVSVLIFFIETYRNYVKQKQMVQDGYNKSMYDTIGYIKNVEAELAKLQVTNTKSLQITTLANIWRESNLAKDNFESLPFEQESLDNTSKYLAQLSDYSYFLMKEVTLNNNFSKEDYDNISKLYIDCKNISLVMNNIYNDLNNGNIHWDELSILGNDALKKSDISDEISNFAQISKTFQQYEGLIYDGAFSDHILYSKPKLLKDNECSINEAQKYIQNLFKDEVENITYIGESNGKIELYNFEVKTNKSEVKKNVYITKKDCRLYLIISDRKVKSENIVTQKAVDIGIEFLKKIGIDNVKETYYQKIENMLIINYASVQDNIILYPDLVKVKIALDNGEVCSVESQGYIYNHQERKDVTPAISIEKAREIVSGNVDIMDEELVIIPTESQNEILCYEFKGKVEDREVLIYINAKTGNEEKVLLILETDGGTLTI